jgi:Xaa-Pro aminopeptidase
MRGRGDRLEALVTEAGLDRLLVTHLVNVRYLSGFRGTNGACVCGPGVRVFLTDFRYTERAANEVDGWEVVTVEGERWVEGLAGWLTGRSGYEDSHVTVRSFGRLEELASDEVELVPDGGLVERLRRVKDEGELEAIRAAAEPADEVYEWTLERGLRGRSELDVARSAEQRMRELGVEPAFPPIVAAGPNGALPHHEHPHVRHRGGPGGRPGGLRAGARGAGRGARGGGRRGRGKRGRSRRPRAHRGRRARRALPPRARPRGRAGGPRGPATRAALR